MKRIPLLILLVYLSGCADAFNLASAVICPIDQGVLLCHPPDVSPDWPASAPYFEPGYGRGRAAMVVPYDTVGGGGWAVNY